MAEWFPSVAFVRVDRAKPSCRGGSSLQPKDVQHVKALGDLKVLDLSRVLAGPFSTQILSDLGATVWKIESPRGDDTRRLGPPFMETESSYFLSINRGKKSICVNLKDPRGQRLVQRMAAEADIIVENFKTGDLARYGLDYASIDRINPGIVYASITGYGHTGPTRIRAGRRHVAAGDDRPDERHRRARPPAVEDGHRGDRSADRHTRGRGHPRRTPRARQDRARTAHRSVAVRHRHHGHGQRGAELHRHGRASPALRERPPSNMSLPDLRGEGRTLVHARRDERRDVSKARPADRPSHDPRGPALRDERGAARAQGGTHTPAYRALSARRTGTSGSTPSPRSASPQAPSTPSTRPSPTSRRRPAASSGTWSTPPSATCR